MPTPVVAGNWKMNTTVAEAVALASDMKEELHRIRGVEKLLCPPFVSLTAVRSIVYGSSIKLGAQNMHYEDRGAYTGEVSPLMVKELCDYVILGHSERRHLLHEDDELVGKKVKAAFRAGLRPILCVGERLEERQAGQAEAVVSRQLRAALEGVVVPGGLVIAYEPVWAIGTGVAATPQDAAAMMEAIGSLLRQRFGPGAEGVPLLYGGSVTAANVAEFVRLPNVHGVLVGGASLRAQEFVEIARQVAQAKGF
jgi:triosephosphate isomerase